jgi:hypothetical protein
MQSLITLNHFANTMLNEPDLEHQITNLAVRTVFIAALIIITATIAALINKNKITWLKLPLFIAIAGSMAGATIILLASTVYLNVKSESGGPVHWHADIEFWVCGTELELRDPIGFLSNKIGTTTYHEHNDKRIHLEGVVVRKNWDASLGKFMAVVGGNIQSDGFALPINEDETTWFVQGDDMDGDRQGSMTADELRPFVKKGTDGLPVAEFTNGQTCNNNNAEVQVFVYTWNKDDNTYFQRKIEKPEDFVIRDESMVPPGDCIIVEFDVPKFRTDKLCEQYGLRDEKRCTEFGVKAYNPELCNAREIVNPEVEE